MQLPEIFECATLLDLAFPLCSLDAESLLGMRIIVKIDVLLLDRLQRFLYCAGSIRTNVSICDAVSCLPECSTCFSIGAFISSMLKFWTLAI